MSQKNIERQELSMTPLEIARNKSAENLKIYGLEFGNGIGKLNFLSRIKHSFRADYPNMDNFDDYSLEFYESLKDFQKNNGLAETGVLDIETIVKIDKKYPFSFNYSEKSKILSYYQNKTEYITTETKNVSKETKEKIIKSELDLVTDNIGKPKNEVLETVRKSLNLTGNLEEMKKQIANFQKMHCLNETDGVIGKETYYEVVAKDYFTNDKQSEILEKGPSKADQKIILEIFENGRIGSVELNKISIILKNFKEKNSTNANFESEFGDFYKKYDALVTEYRKSPAGKADEQMADKNRESLYGAMKKMYNGEMEITEGIKQIATNPALVLTAGITFLFGMWGSETKMSDSWWKRILLLIAAPVAVPAAWKLVGGNEILNDVGNGVKDVKNGLNSSEAQAQKNEIASETHNFIVKEGTETATWVKDRTNEIYNGVKTGDTSKLPSFLGGAAIADKNISKEQIENRIYKDTNEVFNSMFNKNLSYSKSGNESEKSKFIEKEDFTTISNVLYTDLDFTGKLIADVNYVKSDVSKLKEMLSTNTKNTLFGNLSGDKLKKREQDLVTFVDLLLKEKEGKDVYISDIFIKEKGFFERAKESLIENEITTYMKDEPKLNAEITTILASLSLNIKSEVSSILSTINLGDANNEEKINKLTKYINENSAKIGEDKEELELLKNIYLMELEYKKFETNISKIDVNGGKDSLTKLEEEKGNIMKKYREIKLGKPDSEPNKIFKVKINEKYESLKISIIENNRELRESSEYKNILKLDKDFKEFSEKSSKISELPKGEKFSDLQSYITQENMLLYDDVLKIYKNYVDIYKVNSGPDVRPKYIFVDETTGVITANTNNLDEKDKKIAHILVEGNKIEKRLEKLVENVGYMIDDEKSKITTLEQKIRIAKESGNANFEAQVGNFDAELRNIFNTFYPNNKPKDNLDISGWASYISEKNRESSVDKLLYTLSIAKKYYDNQKNHTDIENKSKILYTEITKLGETLAGKKEEVKNESITGRKKEKLDSLPTIKPEYEKFYDAYIKEMKNVGVPDDNALLMLLPKKESNLSLDAYFEFLNNLVDYISAYNGDIKKKNENKTKTEDKLKVISINKFEKEFNEVSLKITNYINQGKI